MQAKQRPALHLSGVSVSSLQNFTESLRCSYRPLRLLHWCGAILGNLASNPNARSFGNLCGQHAGASYPTSSCMPPLATQSWRGGTLLWHEQSAGNERGGSYGQRSNSTPCTGHRTKCRFVHRHNPKSPRHRSGRLRSSLASRFGRWRPIILRIDTFAQSEAPSFSPGARLFDSRADRA